MELVYRAATCDNIAFKDDQRRFVPLAAAFKTDQLAVSECSAFHCSEKDVTQLKLRSLNRHVAKNCQTHTDSISPYLVTVTIPFEKLEAHGIALVTKAENCCDAGRIHVNLGFLKGKPQHWFKIREELLELAVVTLLENCTS